MEIVRFKKNSDTVKDNTIDDNIVRLGKPDVTRPSGISIDFDGNLMAVVNGRLTLNDNEILSKLGYSSNEERIKYKNENPELYKAMNGVKYGITKESERSVRILKERFKTVSNENLSNIYEIIQKDEWQSPEVMSKYCNEIETFENDFIALEKLGYFNGFSNENKELYTKEVGELKGFLNIKKEIYSKYENANEYNQKVVWQEKYASMQWDELDVAEKALKKSGASKELKYVKGLRKGFKNANAYNTYISFSNCSGTEIVEQLCERERVLEDYEKFIFSKESDYYDQVEGLSDIEGANEFYGNKEGIEAHIKETIKDNRYYQNLVDYIENLNIDEKYGSLDQLKLEYIILDELNERNFANGKIKSMVEKAMDDADYLELRKTGENKIKKDKYMTDTEYEIACYYVAKDKTLYKEYLEELDDELKRRKMKEIAANFSEFADMFPNIASAVSVITNLLSAFETVVDTGKFIVTGDLDYNTAAVATSAIRGTVASKKDIKIGDLDVYDMAYGIRMSYYDNLAAMGLSKFVTKSEKFGGIIIGLSAAGNATNNALSRGLSDGYAFANGVAAGVFETVFETWSIGKFSECAKNINYLDIKNLTKFFGKNMWNSALEETLTEVANISYDYLVNGKFSEYESSIKNYIKSGLTEDEAKHKVALETAGRVAESAVAGALSSFVFLANDVSKKKVMDNIDQNIQNIITPLKTLDYYDSNYDSAINLNTKESKSILLRTERQLSNSLRLYDDFNNTSEGIMHSLSNVQENYSNTQYNVKNLSQMTYENQLSAIESGEHNGSNLLHIEVQNEQLKNVGLSTAPFVMTQTDYRNSSNNVPYEFFESLPQHISEPVMVIDNGNRSIIITDYSMRDFSNNNSFVAVEIEKNRQVGNDILNVVRNVYPLDNFERRITEAVDSGKVIVANKNKTNKMLTDIGVQSDKVLRILKYASDGISQGKQRLGNESTVKSNKIINVLTGKEIDGNTYRILQRLENGETVTADEVSNIKEVLEGSKIVDAMREKFIAENPQFANMPKKDIGTYLLNSNERIELRNNIIEERLREGSFSGIDKNGNDKYNGVVEKGKRLDIVIGLPAAGKSSAIVNTLSEFYQSAVIDSDIIKSRLPEFNGGWGAMLVHEESSRMNIILLEEAMKTGNNIVLPIVGSKISSVEKYFAQAKNHNYDVNIHLNELPNRKALGRMLKRYFETGRFIDPYCIIEYANKPTEVYEQIKKRDDISGYSRWSNDVEYGQRPKLIEISENNKLYGIYNETGVMQSRERQSSEITSTENRSDINGYSEERNDTEGEFAGVGGRSELHVLHDGESGQSGRGNVRRTDSEIQSRERQSSEIISTENRSDINGYSEERNDTERESELARVGRRGRLYGIYDGESGQSGREILGRLDKASKRTGEIEHTEGASLTDGVFFDLNTTNAVTKPLESYPAEKQDMIKSYLNSVDENLVDLVERVKKGTNKFERVYISDVNAREAKDIKNLLDIDVEGYTHNINSDSIRHILKRHGVVGNHDNSMSNVNDIARMGWVIENYDNVEILSKNNEISTSSGFVDKNNELSLQIRYSKKINGTYYLVEAAFENNYNKLWVQSAYLKKSESVTRAPDASKKTPEMTSETEHASPLSSDSVSRNKVNVNQEYNKKSESVTQAHTASKDNLPYGHARSAPASPLSNDNVSRNDKNVNNKKTDENTFSIFTKSRDSTKVLSHEEIIKTKELAAAFDINVQFKDLRNTVSKNTTLITPDGYIDSAGNIYINLYAQNPYNFVLKHELAHFGQDTLEYKRYVELVENTDCYYNWLFEITGESDLKRAERKFKEQLAEIDPNVESADSQQAKNELIAYFTADNIFNENGENIMNATMEIEPKHRNAFVRYVVNIIKRIKEKLSKLKWFKNTFADKEISVLENSFKKMVLQGNDKRAKGNYDGDTEYCFAICRDETKIKAAEQMRNENRSYADIYKEHRLIKDAYGNWLVEFDTNGFKFFADGNAKTESHYYNNKLKRENGITEGKLKDFVAYKALFENYPQLQDIRVVIKEVSDKNEKIRYIANANTIFINKDFYNDYKVTKNSTFSGYLLGAIQEAVQYQDGRKSKVTLEQLKEYEKKDMLPYSESLGRNFTAEETYNNFYDNYEVNLAIKRQETKKRLLKKLKADELPQNDAYIPDIDYDEVVVFNSNGDPVISDVNLEDKKLYEKNKEIKSRDFGLRDIINKLENDESVSIDDINSVPIIKKAYEESLKYDETYKNDSIERGKLRENLLKALKDNGSAVIDESGNTEYSGDIIQHHRADIVLGLFETGQMTDPISSRYYSRIISTDTVKTLLPEFNNGIGEASVQSESERIMTDMLDFAVSRGDNLVYSTVGNDYNSLIEKINYFKENGYSVYLHLNEISNNKAIAKSLKRYIETDRFISPNSIFEYGDMPTENFNKIISEDEVDGYSHYVSDVSDEKGLVLKEITDNIKGLNKEFVFKNKHLNTKKRKATSDNEVAFNLRKKTVAKEQMKKELDIYKNSNKLKHTLYPERLSVKNDVSDIVNLRAGSDSLITNVLDKENSITDVFGKAKLDELKRAEIKNFDELNALYSNEILEKFGNSILKNENGSLTSMYAVCRNGRGNIDASPLGFVAGSFESAKYLYSEMREQLSRNTPLYITEIKGNAQNPLVVPFELKNSNTRKFCEWMLENKYIKRSEFSEIARLKSAFDDFGYKNHRSRKIRELVKSKGYDAIIYPNKSTDTGSVKIVFLDYGQVLEVAKNGVLIENNGISENYFDIENAEKIVTSEENTKKFNDFILENSLKIDGKSIPKKVKLGNSGFMEYRTLNKELSEKVFERNIRGKQRVKLSGSDTAKRNVVKNVKEICNNTVFKNDNGDLISFVLTNKSGIDIENSKANECVFSTVENTLAEKENFYERESFCECYLNSYKPLFLQMNDWNVNDAAYCALKSRFISEKFYYSLFETDLSESVINENKITEKFIEHLALKGYDSIVFTNEKGEYKTIVFDKSQMIVISKNGKRISNAKRFSNTDITTNENLTELEYDLKGHSGVLENNGYNNLTAKTAIEILKTRKNNNISQTDTAGRNIEENVKTKLENSILKTKDGVPYSVFVNAKNRNTYNLFGQYASTLKAVQDLTVSEKIKRYDIKSSDFKENFANIENPYFITFDPLDVSVDEFIKYMHQDRIINNIEYVNIMSSWKMNDFDGATAIINTLKSRHFDSILFVNKNYDAGSLGLIVFDGENLLPANATENQDNVSADSFDEPTFFDEKIGNENFVEKSRAELIDKKKRKYYNKLYSKFSASDFDGKRHPITNVLYLKEYVTISGEIKEVLAAKFDSFFDALLPKELYKSCDYIQIKECSAQLMKAIAENENLKNLFTREELEAFSKGKLPKKGRFTWHHDVHEGRMQLVDRYEHQKTSHIGGRKLWGSRSN